MGLFPVTREPVTSLPLHSEIGRKSGSLIELFALIPRRLARPHKNTDPIINVCIPRSSSNHCNRVQFRRVTPNLRIKMAILPYTRVDIGTFRTYGARIFNACGRADIIQLKW
jgi:hypothetical protein